MRTVQRFSMTLVALAATLTACSDGTGIIATGDVAVSLQRQTSSALFLVQDESGTLASLSPDTVASLTVTVTSVQFLRAGDDEDTDGWITLDLVTPVEINLMALPTEAVSPLVIASGSVEVGDYSKVRFFVSDATIVLKGDVSVGGAVTLDGGVEYPVTIPSAAQTGIKTDVSFSVVDDNGVIADVGLLFDATTSLGNVIVTGNGTVMMSPVLRSR